MNKFFLLIKLIAFLFTNSFVYGDGLGEAVLVKGTVVDFGSKSELEFVSVVLIRVQDSVIIDGCITDNKGVFTFKNIPNGSYFLKFTYVGYTNRASSNFEVTNSLRKFNIGTIELSTSNQLLNEVVVTGEKSMFVNSIDRRVYNIEKDMLSQSGAAADLLQNIPSVSVDIDGNVSLRGADNVMILINGKPLNGNATSKANLLQSMQANSIERIEVITNPSAKYKPDGTSGIINIVMKKETKTGFNGTVIANLGNSKRYNTSLAMNYKTEKSNVNMSYGFRQDQRNRLNSETRDFYAPDSLSSDYLLTSENEISSTENGRPFSHNFSLGLDYALNDNNDISIFGKYNYRTRIRLEPTTTLRYDPFGLLTKDEVRTNRGTEPESEYSNNFMFIHRFAKEGHEILINNEYQAGTEEEKFRYTTEYILPVATPEYENTWLREFVAEDNLEIEYTLPISEDMQFEAGYNYSYEKRDMPFIFQYSNAQNSNNVNDSSRTNHFIHTQNIHAVYSTFAHKLGDFSYMLGLRMEQSFIESDLVTLDSIVPNNYPGFYPTSHIKYEFNDNNELQLSYSRRVNRPESDDLNPFPEYRSAYEIRSGNPLLKPEYINAFELGYLLKRDNFNFQTTVYHRRKLNGFTYFTRPINDSVILSTHTNVAKDQSTGFEFIFNNKFFNKINSNLSVNVYYNQFDASNIGLSSNQSNIVWMAKLNSTANLSPTTMLQLNASYWAPRLTSQGRVLENYILNLGLRQDIWNKKGSVIITVSDLLNSMQMKYIVDTESLYRYSLRRRDARIIYAGFVFRFGNATKKTKDDSMQFDNSL